MVTLKRKVKTESGRYGGYSTDMSSSMNNYDRYQTISHADEREDDITSEYYDDSPQYKDYLWNELNRTTSRRILSPEEVRMGVKPEEVREEKRSYVSDYAYSGGAAAYAMPKRTSFSVNSDEREAHGITMKAKLLIVAYVAVVVFFLTLIVINAGTLATLKSEITALEAAGNSGVNNEVVDNTVVVPNAPSVQDNLAFGTGSEENLQNSVYAGDYNLLNVSAPVGYAGNTSWFDSICDWLGGVVGD